MKLKLFSILVLISLAVMPLGAFAQDGTFGESESMESERDKVLYSPGGEGETRYIYRSTPGSGSSTPTNNSTPSTSKETTSKETPVKETSVKETEVKTQETVVAKPKADPLKSGEKQPANTKVNGDDEISSFNFLYYIIQKYKLQDLVD